MAKSKLFPAVFSLLLHGGGGAATMPPPHVPAVTVHRCMPPAARLAGGGVTEALEAVTLTRRRAATATVVWASGMPRVMVEPFLREYLASPAAAAAGGVVVAAREMKVVWGFYTGVMEDGGEVAASPEVRRAMAKVDVDDVVGFSGGSMDLLRSPLVSFCKSKWRALPRREYPRPLVFHDGRLAFLPTPLAAAAMLVWLPFGAALAAARLAVALALPYRLATLLLAATGQSWRLRGSPPPPRAGGEPRRRRGQLYVCNHRTLIDPVYVSIALDRPVRAVSYSLSRVSDLLSPIGATVRLARDRAHDGAAMARLLDEGVHVVVCPEGTTCREPYLLRFSPLFAELADDVVPVALAAETATFYGTTAGGWKSMDALCYLANPRMCYTVEFLPAVDASPVREGKAASTELANAVQRRMAEALGYESTMLTRKDKYLMLAGNDGVVRRRDGAAK
uniref:Phospholipid/glycerol acyltransferase domain-containing protein n=1 Tax=Oryza punctata TaxID=4537 RepID=A0A0E0MNL8_ORYPU